MDHLNTTPPVSDQPFTPKNRHWRRHLDPMIATRRRARKEARKRRMEEGHLPRFHFNH